MEFQELSQHHYVHSYKSGCERACPPTIKVIWIRVFFPAMAYIFPEPQKEKSDTNLSGHVQHVVGRRKQAGWMSPFKSQPLVFISSAREEVLEIDWLHLTTFSPEGLAVITGFGQTERSARVRFQLPVVIFIHLIFSIVKSKQMWQRQGSRFSLKVGAKNLKSHAKHFSFGCLSKTNRVWHR